MIAGIGPLHDLGPVLGIDDLVVVRFASARLEAGGPDVTGLRVAQEDECAPAVARRVLAPAGNGKLAPAAEPGARRRDHDRVAAVREQMRAGRDVVRRLECPQRGEDEIADERGLPNLFTTRPGHAHRARRPFLEQELRRLDHGMGVEAPAGQAVVNHVAQRDEDHPLMVGHVCPDHGHPGLLRQPRGGVVERFVETIGAQRFGLLEAGEVAQGRPGIYHGREGSGVRSHHHVLEQPPLESQAGHAESRVLIRELQVAKVVARFRDPPRDSPLRAVADLASHYEAAAQI